MIGRISQKGVFGRLNREGTYVRHRGLWVSCLRDGTLSSPHVAYAIGRSVGNAVTRNRIRRRLRQLMAQREATLEPAWYLIGVSNADAAPSWTLLDQRLTTLLELVHQRLDHTKSTPSVMT